MSKAPKKQWMLYTKRADFQEIAQRFHIDPVVARILRNRDIIGEEAIRAYLCGGISDLYDGALLPHAEEAAEMLFRKLREGTHIRIVGDYDIDGVCATYILYRGLLRAAEACGKKTKIDQVIPDRVKDGYGINEQIVRRAAADGADLILTCDNGIAAVDELRLAKELGLAVIVTDHHDIRMKACGGTNEETEAGKRTENRAEAAAQSGMKAGTQSGTEAHAAEEAEPILPPADVVIDPKLPESRYPLQGICGAVVAWKLLGLLYARCRISRDEWLQFLEFAAVATVGDVMELRDENRILVKEGLKRLNAGAENPGLRKLIEACGLADKKLTAYHIGFVLGPCINAGGRLESAETALRLFLSEDEQERERLAAYLCALNNERKEMTEQGTEEAARQAEELYAADSVLVIFLPTLHESLAGIVAGRIREQFGKPCFVLTRSGELVKGSGRSIEAYHMFEGLCGVSHLLLKYGGHPMAAGFSLAEKYVDAFRKELNQQAKLKEEDFIQKLWLDMELPLSYLSGSLVRGLSALEPFGNGNPAPLFALRGARLSDMQVLGKNRNVLRLNVTDQSGVLVQAVLFGEADRMRKELSEAERFNICYDPRINEFNGRSSLQIVIHGYMPCIKQRL